MTASHAVWASGVARIVAVEGGPAEQVHHGEDGLVVDLDRPGALADSMALALGNAPHRERMGRAARSAAASRSWDSFLDSLFPGRGAPDFVAEFARAGGVEPVPERGEVEYVRYRPGRSCVVLWSLPTRSGESFQLYAKLVARDRARGAS